MKSYPKVEVTWLDAISDSCWIEIEDILTKKPELCTSIGFLIDETPNEYRLSCTISNNGSSMGFLVIPKKFATSMKEL